MWTSLTMYMLNNIGEKGGGGGVSFREARVDVVYFMATILLKCAVASHVPSSNISVGLLLCTPSWDIYKKQQQVLSMPCWLFCMRQIKMWIQI